MYDVRYARSAGKTLCRLPCNVATLIEDKVTALAMVPRAPDNNVKKLVGRPGLHLRVGDRRIIYELHDDVLVVLVLEIAPRGGAYD